MPGNQRSCKDRQVSRVTRRISKESRDVSKDKTSQCKALQAKAYGEQRRSRRNDVHKNIHSITSISTIQDLHVSDRREDDEGVKVKEGCLHMLTRMYQ